jgi:hypothetical protein
MYNKKCTKLLTNFIYHIMLYLVQMCILDGNLTHNIALISTEVLTTIRLRPWQRWLF